MNSYLLIAGILTILMSIAHSFFGEILILKPLKKSEGLPAVRGSVRATKLTLRFTWHITSMLGVGMATILVYYSRLTAYSMDQIFVLQTLSLTFFICFLISIIGSRVRHPSWIIFIVVSILTWLSTGT